MTLTVPVERLSVPEKLLSSVCVCMCVYVSVCARVCVFLLRSKSRV